MDTPKDTDGRPITAAVIESIDRQYSEILKNDPLVSCSYKLAQSLCLSEVDTLRAMVINLANQKDILIRHAESNKTIKNQTKEEVTKETVQGMEST